MIYCRYMKKLSLTILSIAIITFAFSVHAETTDAKPEIKATDNKTANLLTVPKNTLKKEEKVDAKKVPSKKNIKEVELIRSLDRFSLLNDRFESFFEKNKESLAKIELAKVEIQNAKDSIDTTDKDAYSSDEEIKTVKDSLINARKYLAEALRIARKNTQSEEKAANPNEASE